MKTKTRNVAIRIYQSIGVIVFIIGVILATFGMHYSNSTSEIIRNIVLLVISLVVGCYMICDAERCLKK